MSFWLGCGSHEARLARVAAANCRVSRIRNRHTSQQRRCRQCRTTGGNCGGAQSECDYRRLWRVDAVGLYSLLSRRWLSRTHEMQRFGKLFFLFSLNILSNRVDSCMTFFRLTLIWMWMRWTWAKWRSANWCRRIRRRSKRAPMCAPKADRKSERKISLCWLQLRLEQTKQLFLTYFSN